MAGAWGNARFAAPEPRQEIGLAAGLHDIGWLDWERAPQFDPQTGWPRVFADVPAEQHTKLWQRGVEHVATISRYAAILVSMHGDTIYDKTFEPATARPEAAEAVRRFRAEGAAFQQQAVATLRGDPILSRYVSEAQLAYAKKLVAALEHAVPAAVLGRGARRDRRRADAGGRGGGADPRQDRARRGERSGCHSIPGPFRCPA